VVEMEVKETKPEAEKANMTNIDVTEIINKVRDFVENVREMSGKPVDVKVEAFNFAFGKDENQYNLSLDTKISIKPKAA